MEYTKYINQIEKVLQSTLFATLATGYNGIIHTRQMCLVNDGLKVYMQTDKIFQKVEEIQKNENVAINCGAFNFTGKAKIVGAPKDNEMFIQKMKEKHLKTYEHYTNLPNEVLIEIDLTECSIWGIDNGKEVHNQETITIVNFVDKSVKQIVCDKM